MKHASQRGLSFVATGKTECKGGHGVVFGAAGLAHRGGKRDHPCDETVCVMLNWIHAILVPHKSDFSQAQSAKVLHVKGSGTIECR